MTGVDVGVQIGVVEDAGGGLSGDVNVGAVAVQEDCVRVAMQRGKVVVAEVVQMRRRRSARLPSTLRGVHGCCVQ